MSIVSFDYLMTEERITKKRQEKMEVNVLNRWDSFVNLEDALKRKGNLRDQTNCVVGLAKRDLAPIAKLAQRFGNVDPAIIQKVVSVLESMHSLSQEHLLQMG